MQQDEGFEDLDKIAEELEQQEQENEKEKSPYHEAYKQWEETGDPALLENLIHQKSQSHALKLIEDFKGPFSKKGGIIDYNETDVFLLGFTATSLTFIVHPLFLTLWIGLAVKGMQYRFRQCEDVKAEAKSFVAKIAKELHYYLTGSAIPAYYFVEIKGMTLQLGDAGTLAQLLQVFFGA